jgi:sirohydrochlorin ferrochelatase
MHEFARLRQAESGYRTEVAFLAMARPLLPEKLARIAAERPANVVVQPHLLFQGDLVDSLRQQVEDAQATHAATKWAAAPLLADESGTVGVGSELLERAIMDRWNETLIRVAAEWGDD